MTVSYRSAFAVPSGFCVSLSPKPGQSKYGQSKPGPSKYGPSIQTAQAPRPTTFLPEPSYYANPAHRETAQASTASR